MTAPVFIKSKKFEHLVQTIDRAAASKKIGKVGWVEGSKYPNGTSVASVARTQEYGDPSKRIPPRPMLQPTAEKNQNAWSNLVKNLTNEVVKNNGDFENVLEGLVQRAAGDVRKTISKLTEPPLRPSTIAARLKKRKNKTLRGKLDKPLVDTGVLLNTVTGVVEEP